MSFVVIGLKGKDQVYVLDTEALTVSTVEASSVLGENVATARASGTPYISGVDVAVAVEHRADPSAIWYFENK